VYNCCYGSIIGPQRVLDLWAVHTYATPCCAAVVKRFLFLLANCSNAHRICERPFRKQHGMVVWLSENGTDCKLCCSQTVIEMGDRSLICLLDMLSAT